MNTGHIIRHANRVTPAPRRITRADGSTGYRTRSAARAAADRARYDRAARADATAGKDA